jgi:8-oxo-dGTP pyrophosphatase MutT (NUDIX family)
VTENKKTRVALRLVIIKNGKLLVTYNSESNIYYYIGGRLEFGETIAECATREIKEELGESVDSEFNKILYIRDFIMPDKDVHNVELFVLGDINKFEEVEHFVDPEHNGRNWSTWLEMDNLPVNLYPKPLTKKVVEDYKNKFVNSGEYVGTMTSE